MATKAKESSTKSTKVTAKSSTKSIDKSKAIKEEKPKAEPKPKAVKEEKTKAEPKPKVVKEEKAKVEPKPKVVKEEKAKVEPKPKAIKEEKAKVEPSATVKKKEAPLKIQAVLLQGLNIAGFKILDTRTNDSKNLSFSHFKARVEKNQVEGVKLLSYKGDDVYTGIDYQNLPIVNLKTSEETLSLKNLKGVAIFEEGAVLLV